MDFGETIGILICVLVAIGVLVCVAYSVICAAVLSWRLVADGARGRLSGYWGFVLGAGWFLALGGCDLLRDSKAIGGWMLGGACAAWIGAAILHRRTPTA